jgi:hypothetical protein
MIIERRHPEWESRWAAVRDAWTGRVHKPANGKDCAAFVLASIAAVSGRKLAVPKLRRYNSEAGQTRAMLEVGWNDLLDAADELLGDRIAPLAAHRGDVVSDGSTLGIMDVRGAWFFGEGGMVQIDRIALTAAWPVGRAF